MKTPYDKEYLCIKCLECQKKVGWSYNVDNIYAPIDVFERLAK